MSSQLSKRAKFWQQHIEAAKSFRGSAAQYCDRERIALQSFYQWRSRLSSSKIPARANAFAPVEILAASGQQSSPQYRTLPDPKWTAMFVSHLLQEMTR